MDSKFKAKYQAEDGYVGKDRPLYCYIDSSEIEEGMSDDELEKIYDELIEEDFQQKVCPVGENLDEFMQWARSVRDSL